jgi:hypothetical protein
MAREEVGQQLRRSLGCPSPRSRTCWVAFRDSSWLQELLDWLGDTGATKVAIHFDVDTIDADEIQLGLGADLGGLTTTEARRVVADLDGAAEVVALTIAEFIPRQVMHLQQILTGFPLLGPRA